MNTNLVSIGDLFQVSSGGTPSRKKLEYFEGGKIPWVKTGELKGKYASEPTEFITQLGLSNSSAKLFPPKTVLLAMYGATIGACSILSFESATNQACAAILPNDECDESYLYYYLSSIKADLINKGVGGAQPNISAGLIKKIKIPLPPLDEQRKIAAVLDAADQLRQKDQQLIDHYTTLSQSLFLEMFGDPISNPMGWDKGELNQYCRKITDGTHQSPKFVNNGIPFLLVSNIVNNRIDYTTKKYISEKEYRTLTKNTPIEVGDILYTSVGSYGNPAIVDSEIQFCFQRHIAHLKLDLERMHSYFLHALLQTSYIKRQADRLARGVAQKTLNLAAIKSYEIICPPMLLQEEYFQRISAINQQTQQVQTSKIKAQELFNGLLQRAFKGELTSSKAA